jgi:hypothetical protein
MKKLFENWRKHLNEDKESEDRRAQQIAQKYGLPDEPPLYGAEAIILSDGNLGIQVRIPSPSGYDRGLKLVFDNADHFENTMKGMESLSGNELYQKLFDTWQKEREDRSWGPEKEAMEDLAEAFGVEVEFSTKFGRRIAIVTFEDGEQMGYRDEEEMYQDLRKRAG